MEEHDSKEIYCRKLGHNVPFKYCRLETGTLPCGKIKDCWFEKLDISGFIDSHYSEGEAAQIFKQGKTRISSIIELMEKARSR